MRDIETKIDNTAPAASGRLPAAQFDSIQSELKGAVTQSGLLLDGANGPDTNLAMLAEAICRSASGGVGYRDTGAANAYVLTTPGSFVTPKAIFSMMWANWVPGNTNTGASTANVSGIGVKPIVTYLGAALIGGELLAGFPAQMFYSPTIILGGAWVLAPWASALLVSSSKILTAPRTLYVSSTTGNDNNDGLTTGTAFATLQKAANTVVAYNLNGYAVQVIVANGTYAPVALAPLNGSGSCTWIGNSTTPANCLISSGNGQGAGILANGAGANYAFNGFKVVSTGTLDFAWSGRGIGAYLGGILSLSNMEVGACTEAQIISASSGSNIILSTKLIVSGGAQYHTYCTGAGNLACAPQSLPALSITAAVSIGVWARADALGIAGLIYGSIAGSGNVTGQKYNATANGIVTTNTGNTSYLPGTVAGATSTGGQYT